MKNLYILFVALSVSVCSLRGGKEISYLGPKVIEFNSSGEMTSCSTLLSTDESYFVDKITTMFPTPKLCSQEGVYTLWPNHNRLNVCDKNNLAKIIVDNAWPNRSTPLKWTTDGIVFEVIDTFGGYQETQDGPCSNLVFLVKKYKKNNNDIACVKACLYLYEVEKSWCNNTQTTLIKVFRKKGIIHTGGLLAVSKNGHTIAWGNTVEKKIALYSRTRHEYKNIPYPLEAKSPFPSFLQLNENGSLVALCVPLPNNAKAIYLYNYFEIIF